MRWSCCRATSVKQATDRKVGTRKKTKLPAPCEIFVNKFGYSAVSWLLKKSEGSVGGSGHKLMFWECLRIGRKNVTK
jgi:hypothetical protein